MPLKRLIGQSRARRIIESMIEGDRIPHALLFWGPAGVGKSAAAIEIARRLNCENTVEAPCDTCESCIKYQSLQHPHFSYQIPIPGKLVTNSDTGELSEAGANELAKVLTSKGNDPYISAEIAGGQFILIGQIRSLINWASLRSFSEKHRIALIEHADRLKEEAGNALLKLLEEPPPNFILILTAVTPEDLLPTLVSRCHLIEFERLGIDVIEQELQRRGVAGPEEISRIAHLSGGNLSRALEYAQNPEATKKLHEFGINVVRHSLGKNPLEINSLLEQWVGFDASDRLLILEIIASWLRDAAVIKELGDAGIPRLIHSEQVALLKKFVSNCPKADYIASAKAADEARWQLHSNTLPQLVFLVLARRLYRTIYQRQPN